MAESSASLNPKRIDVNLVSADVLAGLEEIDRELAERIVRHRSERGAFTTVGELAEVRGVSQDLVQRLEGVLYASPGDSGGADRAGESDHEATTPEVPTTSAPQPALPEGEDQASADSALPGSAPKGKRPDGQPARIEPPAQPAGALEAGATRIIKLPGRVQPVSEEAIEMGAPSSAPKDSGPAMTTAASAEVAGAAAEVEAGDALADLHPEPEGAPRGDAAPPEDQAAAEAARPVGSLARERAIVREHVRPRERSRSTWQIILPALVGGIVGAVVTLVVVGIWFAAFDVVRRPEMEALSSNLDIVAQNTEVIWSRVNDLGTGLEGIASDLATLREDLTFLNEGLREAAESIDLLDEQTDDLDRRLQATGDTLATLDATVSNMQETVDSVDARIAEFDGFFAGLLELVQTLGK